MKKTPDDQPYSDEEVTRRMNEVVKRMINTPPTPHKPLGKPKLAKNASPKKRGRPKQEKRARSLPRYD
jgi:hypothetical protein